MNSWIMRRAAEAQVLPRPAPALRRRWRTRRTIGAGAISLLVLGCSAGAGSGDSAGGGSSGGGGSATASGTASRSGASSSPNPASGGSAPAASDDAGAEAQAPALDASSGPSSQDGGAPDSSAPGTADAAPPDTTGPSDASGPGEAASGMDAGPAFPTDAGAAFASLFDGTSLSGWIQVPAASWSVIGGAMHSLGTARGYIYTVKTYGDFRLVFHSRLVSDPANHNPCVLFWGTEAAPADALGGIQIQPPQGYMWDYRKTGPTANKSPDIYEKRFGHGPLVSKQWSQCEMLANRAQGTLRFACCQLTGATSCKAAEVVDFHDPIAGRDAPIALQVHNATMIEEFSDIAVESPVADPNNLLTTQW